MAMEITIIATKDTDTGIFKNKDIGEYEVVDKDQLVKRIEELTDDNYGYTILISTKEERRNKAKNFKEDIKWLVIEDFDDGSLQIAKDTSDFNDWEDKTYFVPYKYGGGK